MFELSRKDRAGFLKVSVFVRSALTQSVFGCPGANEQVVYLGRRVYDEFLPNPLEDGFACIPLATIFVTINATLLILQLEMCRDEIGPAFKFIRAHEDAHARE